MGERGESVSLAPGAELPGQSEPVQAPAAAAAAIPPVGLWALFLPSLGWAGSARLVSALGAAARYVVFARLLKPFDFGVFGAATVAQVILYNVADLNFSRALVPRKEEIHEYLDTVWSVEIARGLLIALILIAAAGPLARFFRIGDLTVAFVAIAPFSIVTGLASPAVAAQIYRNLDFRVSLVLNLAELAGGFACGLAGILVWHDWRGLMASIYGAQIARSALTYYYFPYRPRLAFSARRAGHLLQFGGWVSARRLAETAARRLDSLAVGHFLGASELGEYQLAFRVAELPTFEIAYAVGLVLFPIIRRLDRASLDRLLWTANAVVVLSGILYAAAIWGWGAPLISLTVGAKWLGALAPLRLLCVFGIFGGLVAVGVQCLDGLNAPAAAFKISLLSAAILAILVVPLTAVFGVNGTAAALVASVVIPLPRLFALQRAARSPLQ
jgi:O-antigen/teichoic acid export membrane protein